MTGTTAYLIASGEYDGYTVGPVFADRGDAEQFAADRNRAKPTQAMQSRLNGIKYGEDLDGLISVDDLPSEFWLPGETDMDALRVEEVPFFGPGQQPEDSDPDARRSL